MSKRTIPTFTQVTEYTQDQENSYALTLIGRKYGYISIYNTTLNKIRVWDGGRFIDAPIIPPSTIGFNGLTNITVGTISPINPNVGDLWVDLN